MMVAIVRLLQSRSRLQPKIGARDTECSVVRASRLLAPLREISGHEFLRCAFSIAIASMAQGELALPNVQEECQLIRDNRTIAWTGTWCAITT
jgi:hypothetical protein